MIYNKTLIKDLLLCNSGDKNVCKYGTMVLKYLITLDGDKITSTNDCPIFFEKDNEGKANLHPYVMNYYSNLGNYHATNFHEEIIHETKTELPYSNTSVISSSHLEEPVKMLKIGNVQNITMFKKFIIDNIINFRNVKFYKPNFLKKFNYEESYIKKNIKDIFNNNIIRDIMFIIDNSNDDNQENKYDIANYLFERDMLTQYMISIKVIFDNIFNKNDFDKVETSNQEIIEKMNNKELDNDFKFLLNNYIKIHTMHKKIINQFDVKNMNHEVTYMQPISRSGIYQGSEFMKLFVPLIDTSIINQVFYYDSNNKKTNLPKFDENILRTVYVNSYNNTVNSIKK